MEVFIKGSDEERVFGAIVYKADTPDADGEWCTAEDIYAGMKSWMRAGHPLRLEHKGDSLKDVSLIECVQAEQDIIKGGKVIPSGAWYVSVYVGASQEALWQEIKNGGAVSGLSMGGRATAAEEE